MSQTAIEEKPTQPTKHLKIIISIFSVLLIILIYANRSLIGQFSQYGYLGVFLVSLFGNATVLMPLPILGSITVIGSALHPLFVGLVASIGAALGESVGYFLGMGGSLVIENNKNYQKAKSYIDRYGVWAIFILALFPNPLFDLAGLMAGASNITYRKFFLAVWTGTFIKYTVFATVGFSFRL